MIPRLRYFLASPWAIAFTVLVSILLGIGSFPLFDVDEGAFSEASREMVETGNFAATWLDGEPRYDKPIFSYWMQAASISIFGHSEWAFRLPSALATIAWLVVLWRFGLAHLGRRRAIAAVLLLGNCLWVGLIGKAAIADAWLNLWLTLALLDIYRYFEADGERRSLALMVFLWMGLGFLTKGPVAVAIPLLVAIAFFVLEGRWRDLLRAGLDPAGIGIFVVVVAPWLFLVFHAQGWEFFAAFFGKHNLGRFTGTMEGHGGSLFYYVYVFPFVILPFTGLLVVLATRWRKLVRDPLGRFCLTWFAVVLLIFSFSNTQLPHYVLNAVVPLAILCAREALARVSPMVLAVPALFLFLIIGLAISVGSGLINANEHVSAMLLLGREVFDTSWLVSAGVALALVLLVVFLPRVSTWQKLVLSGFVQNAFVFSLFVPAVAGMQQQPVKDAAMIARTLGRPIVAYAIHMPSFSVYRDAITPHRMPGEGEIVFTRNDRVAELRERLAGQNLGAQPIFAKGAIRLLLVHPLSSPKESEVEAVP